MCKPTIVRAVIAAAVVGITARAPRLAAQEPAALPLPTPRELAAWVPEAADRELRQLQESTPTVHVYSQLRGSLRGLDNDVLDDDELLTRLVWKDSPVFEAMNLYGPTHASGALSKYASERKKIPSELAAVLVPDPQGLTADRYEFSLVGRSPLDDVPCLVVDVRPRAQGFRGRLWLHEQQLALLRFNGGSVLNRAVSDLLKRRGVYHVDSWRDQAPGDAWVPSMSYVIEERRPGSALTEPRVEMQVRAWHYVSDTAVDVRGDSDVVVDEATVVDDDLPPTPVGSARLQRREARRNIADWLAARGVLAPAGSLDGVVCGVANRLLYALRPSTEVPFECRTLLVSSIDVLVLDRTLAVSRGLIDTANDVPTLARVLAHFMSLALADNSIDITLAFTDRLMRPNAEVLSVLHRPYTPAEEDAADRLTVKMLNASPYRDKLANSTVFVSAVAEYASRLPALLPPVFRDHLADRRRIVASGIRVWRPPVEDPEDLDQLAARPLGSRVGVDSASARTELLPIPVDVIEKPTEKLVFAIAPLRPHFRRVRADGVQTKKSPDRDR